MDIETFLDKWLGKEGGAERANYQMFLSELCDVLGVTRPNPAHSPNNMNDYVFERGQTFTGPVVHIIDGDGLCVEVPNTNVEGTKVGDNWVEVRIADFYAPETSEPGGTEATQALTRIAFGKPVSCKADHRSYDRVVAQCFLDGKSLGDLMREAHIAEGGRAYKPKPVPAAPAPVEP